jgi:hypothetical protein
VEVRRGGWKNSPKQLIGFGEHVGTYEKEVGGKGTLGIGRFGGVFPVAGAFCQDF